MFALAAALYVVLRKLNGNLVNLSKKDVRYGSADGGGGKRAGKPGKNTGRGGSSAPPPKRLLSQVVSPVTACGKPLDILRGNPGCCLSC